jgi:hypothetical protein
LQSKLLVDTWELRNPTVYGTINAFIPPLRAIEYVNDTAKTATAIQDIYLTSRYRGDTSYDLLPLGVLEQLNATLQYRLSTGFLDIAPIIDLECLKVDNPVQVMEYGDGLADWLVTLELSVGITFILTPTPLPGDTTPPNVIVKTINTGLFTEHLASLDHNDPAQRDKFGTLVTKKA